MKKIYMKKFSLWSFMLFALFVTMFRISFGQIDNYIPPSPNASSLARFADMQVSEYTGTPHISIPIYTVKSGDLSLPITLDYHASGIRVEQEASWVGLGWSLNAGGCITRQIRGEDDFDAYSGYIITGPLPPSTAENTPLWGTTQQNNQYIQTYRNISSGYLDGEPDLFYYNFNGYSGKMIFEKQTGTVLKPTPLTQNGIDFSYNRTTQEWQVIDDKGIKYVFGKREGTINYYEKGPSRYEPDMCFMNSDGLKTSSWYLTKIESPAGFSINFIYDNITHQTISQVQRSELIHQLTELKLISSSGDGYLSPQVTGYQEKHNASMQEVEDVYLQEIVFDNGKLTFTLGDRIDMRSRNSNKPQLLEEIDIYDVNNNPVKTFDFHYNYFNQNRATADELRLKLDSLKEITGGVSLPAYKFYYNTSVTLPSKTSYSMDHWGFYNSRDNESVLQYNFLNIKDYVDNNYSFGFPVDEELGLTSKKTLVPYLEYKQGTSVFFQGANRQPNPLVMQTATLTKIKYPTGGTSEFEYEPNTYYAPDSLFRDKIWQYSVAFIEQVPVSGRTNNFTLTENTMLLLDYTFKEGTSGTPGTYSTAKATLKKSNGSSIIEFKPTDSDFTSHIGIYLPPGQYVLNVDCPNDIYDQQFLTATFKEKEYVENPIGGGIRIHQIINKDRSGSIANIEKYGYEDLGKSTGKLMSPLKYFYNDDFIETLSYPIPGNIIQYIYNESYIVRSSTSCIPFGNSAQGSLVGYNRVVKTNESSMGISNGKTIYYFRNTPELQTEFFIPGVPSHVFNDNGYLVKSEKYDQSNRLVQKSTFAYSKVPGSDRIIEGVKTYDFYGVANNINPEARYYDNYSEWWHLVADTTYTYSSGVSGEFIRNSSQYYYENSNHKLLTRKVIEESNGLKTEMRTRYTGDMSDNGGVYTLMVGKNMLDYPVEQITLRNNKIIDGRLTTFKAAGANYVPDSVYLIETVAPLTTFTYYNGKIKDSHYSTAPEIVFNQYSSSKTNLLQSTSRNGVTTSYLWDVTGNYLKAKVEGANYSQISAQNGKTADYNSRTLRNDLNSLVPGAYIQTFSYKPLYGISWQTDPNGVSTNYEYDSFGRLIQIKNDDTDIQRTFDYHYSRSN